MFFLLYTLPSLHPLTKTSPPAPAQTASVANVRNTWGMHQNATMNQRLAFLHLTRNRRILRRY
jgi:hypothetical protein